MKVINSGNRYEIYSDDLKTYDELPSKTYKVTFNPMSGYSLIKVDDFESTEPVVYGDRTSKIDKVFNAYTHMNRSLGIILSGDKGIGKSLFTQMLAKEANNIGLPVILVTNAYPGIADFIDSIQQEVLVLFDEFEKVFSNEDGHDNSQNKLLSLFDGLSQQKRIYAITINKMYNVSEFMINRPGRFHYHFRFEYPDAEEITTYMHDKLDSAYYNQISKVISFSRRMSLNYDCLRAIATELNFGTPFTDAIQDSNILNIENKAYDIECHIDGLPPIKKSQTLDMFANSVTFRTETDDDIVINITLDTTKSEISGESLIFTGEGVDVNAYTYLDSDDNDYERINTLCEKINCHKVIVTPQKVKTYGFNAY